MQWLVCQLHANEFPLRHLLEHLDGPTSGPTAFCGAIGKALSTCEQLTIVQFDNIEVDFQLVTSTKYRSAISITNVPNCFEWKLFCGFFDA